MKITGALLFLSGLIFSGLAASAQPKQEPVPFREFFDSKEMTERKGYFSVYQSADHYYLEVPEKEFGKDILISTQVVRGYSNYVSGLSGIVQIKRGRNNTLDLFKNESTTFPADSTDFCMMNAIRNSGMVPVYHRFPIVAVGKAHKSVIIDLTPELNSPHGIFDVSEVANLNNPDGARSRLEGIRMIERGVVFTALRTQSQFVEDAQNEENTNTVSTYRIEMLIQRVPDHDVKLKKGNPAYGFNQVKRVEYDTRKFMANETEYIKRWSLNASAKNKKLQQEGVAVEPEHPIEVWIDPVTPAPFAESIKAALSQWETAFVKAGWKNVFRFSDDGALGYKKLVFYWGNAYNGNVTSVVTDPVNGEILAARISLMDESAKDMQINYFLWCGLVDPRIQSEPLPLQLRQQILTSQLAGSVGEILGLKENYPAYTAFSPEQLRNRTWLEQWGPTASVVGSKMVDYLVQPGDKTDPSLLLPKVSLYDFEAIAYAYSDRTELPSMKSCYYAASDELDPLAQPMLLSNDLLEASELGVKNLERIYPKIPAIVDQWPAQQSGPDQIARLAGQAFSLYQFFVNQMATYVGGRSKRAVIRGKNEVPLRYVPKARQQEVLRALEKYVFSGTPEWFYNAEINRVFPVDLRKYAVDMANGVLKNLMRKEVLTSLADAENEMGKDAFRCSDLFDYFDRVIFAGYNPDVSFSRVQLSIQLQFAVNLIQAASENNITGGLTDSSAMLNLYLIHVRDELNLLQTNDTIDPELRENCRLILFRMNREFFNKTV